MREWTNAQEGLRGPTSCSTNATNSPLSVSSSFDSLFFSLPSSVPLALWGHRHRGSLSRQVHRPTAVPGAPHHLPPHLQCHRPWDRTGSQAFEEAGGPGQDRAPPGQHPPSSPDGTPSPILAKGCTGIWEFGARTRGSPAAAVAGSGALWVRGRGAGVGPSSSASVPGGSRPGCGVERCLRLSQGNVISP